MLKILLIPAVVFAAMPIFSQEEEAVPTEEETVEVELVVPETAPVPKPDENAKYWLLKGGGEVVGRLMKETPREVYVDIGPEIISLPTDSIVSSRRLGEEPEGQDVAAGKGTGVFDEETGSIIFRSRAETAEMMSAQEIIDEVKKSVVLVSNPRGLGTGWIINEEGLLVTNHHVVGNEPYQSVTVFTKKGDQWEKTKIDNCKVEAFSSLYDIALVQLDMEKVREEGLNLYPIEIAEPGRLEVGDRVFAVGNPGMGRMVLEHTVSEGIVSSMSRNFGDILYIQTTAAVNPGNSGGPLVNENGEVAGLVTLKASFQEGIAFALPVALIRHFLRNEKAYAFSDQAQNKGYRYLPPE